MSGAGIWQAIRLPASLRPSEGTVIAEGTRAEMLEHWRPGEVALCWRYDAPPPKRLSPEGLASVRQKRLRRRLEAKMPLFADQLFADELRRRPEHFAGKRQP